MQGGATLVMGIARPPQRRGSSPLYRWEVRWSGLLSRPAPARSPSAAAVAQDRRVPPGARAGDEAGGAEAVYKDCRPLREGRRKLF
jgi:hypothetical protein